VRAPLPAHEPLLVQAHLSHVEVEPYKARMTTHIVTGTATVPEAIVADLHAVVPLKPRKEGNKRPRPTVPEEASKLAEHALTPRSGLDFALLTGDFNPIHWVRPYAKMAGFRSTILHGFASLALAWEDVVRVHLKGDPNPLTMMDVRFVRPLHLPANVGVFLSESEKGENQLHVGTEPGGEAFMIGTFQTRGKHE
jgi:acyl dehydratase